MIETRSGLYTKQGQKVPLLGVEIDGRVFGGHAQVRVRQRYKNTEARPIEAVYTFPLPSDATLMAFEMTCDGRKLEGVVREREQAFREYDQAVSSGHGAALLDQERPNVFTAQVGNLLPNEETLVDVTYVEPVRADEGVLRWSVPTLVAPRYIPGTPKGDRTAHGEANPTDRVPDADRITPPIGDARYGLKLQVTFDVGKPVRVESPSHAIATVEEQGRTRVTFAQAEVALDRDVVLTARGVDGGAFDTLAVHHEAGKPGSFALTLVPDLFRPDRSAAPQEVIFLVDVSGSMEGASIVEAKSALRLCLRHLREGDRFNIVAFDDRFRVFSDAPSVFSQATLERADAWAQALEADGGTELLAPTLHALRSAPDATLVLLTDGQVGNEAEILEQVLKTRRRARIYSFGIGTNVSDALLRDLARETGGAVEFIHPGERIDEKVVAQFARAIAPRVDEVTVRFDGVSVFDLSPAPLRPLVDGEPWTLFGRYDGSGRGRVEIQGARYLPGDAAPEKFSWSVPIELPERVDAPYVQRLWARERVRDLESASLRGRRAEANKQRIVELAVENQLMTAHTSFVVIEHRTGARLATGQPETRVVPVNVPAGWAMFEDGAKQRGGGGYVGRPPLMQALRGGMPKPSPAPGVAMPVYATRASAGAKAKGGPGAAPPAPPSAKADFSDVLQSGVEESFVADKKEAETGVLGVLSRQRASGLWQDGSASDDVSVAKATARALLELLRDGVTTSHALHGAQVRKAVSALAALLAKVQAKDPVVAEFAASVAWLVATGPRSRGEVEHALAGDGALTQVKAALVNEAAVRTRVDALAAQVS